MADRAIRVGIIGIGKHAANVSRPHLLPAATRRTGHARRPSLPGADVAAQRLGIPEAYAVVGATIHTEGLEAAAAQAWASVEQ
jgi:predicted dehydrogenase